MGNWWCLAVLCCANLGDGLFGGELLLGSTLMPITIGPWEDDALAVWHEADGDTPMGILTRRRLTATISCYHGRVTTPAGTIPLTAWLSPDAQALTLNTSRPDTITDDVPADALRRLRRRAQFSLRQEN